MEGLSTNSRQISFDWYGNSKGLTKKKEYIYIYIYIERERETKNVYYVQSNMYQWRNAAKNGIYVL